MIKKLKVVATLLSTAIALSASIPDVTAAEKYSATQVQKTYAIVVNGKSIEDVSAFEENGVLSVQLIPVVKTIGEMIKWDAETETAIIIKKDQTVVKITVNKTIAKVNDKDVLLSTKKFDNVIVPGTAKAVIADGNLFVPIEALENAFEYSVQVKDKGSEKIVLIQEMTGEKKRKEILKSTVKSGKLDLPYPVSDWVPPLIRSSATADYWKNNSILEKELGLIKGSFFNPHGGNQIELAKIQVGNGNVKTDIAQISFTAWYGSETSVNVNNKIPYVGREIFKFFLPNDYEKLFEIMNQGLTGKLDGPKFLNKEFTFDGRKVTIKKLGDGVSVFIGKK